MFRSQQGVNSWFHLNALDVFSCFWCITYSMLSKQRYILNQQMENIFDEKSTLALNLTMENRITNDGS